MEETIRFFMNQGNRACPPFAHNRGQTNQTVRGQIGRSAHLFPGTGDVRAPGCVTTSAG